MAEDVHQELALSLERKRGLEERVRVAEAELEGLEGELVDLNGAGTDQDGSIIAYQWVSDIDGDLSDQAAFTTDTLSPDDHVITFRVQDNEGLWSNWEYAALEVNGRPTVNVTKTTPDAKVGQTIKMEGTADDDGQVTVVEVAIDDGDWGPVSGTDEWTYTLDASDLADGKHILKVRAYDGSQYSEVVTFEVTIDSDKDDDGSAPPLVMAMAAVVLAVFCHRRWRRRG